MTNVTKHDKCDKMLKNATKWESVTKHDRFDKINTTNMTKEEKCDKMDKCEKR